MILNNIAFTGQIREFNIYPIILYIYVCDVDGASASNLMQDELIN